MKKAPNEIKGKAKELLEYARKRGMLLVDGGLYTARGKLVARVRILN